MKRTLESLVSVLFLGLFWSLFLPTHAFAFSYLYPGTTRYGSTVYDVLDEGLDLHIPALKDTSYFCRAVGFDESQQVTFPDTLVPPIGSPQPTLVFRGAADGSNTINAQAFAFIALGTGNHFISVETSTGTAPDPGGGYNAFALLQCFMTSLFGNFNTVKAANPFNFLELKNISNVTINVLIIVNNFDGTEVTRTNRDISPGTRKDIGIHDTLGAPDTFGLITVSHDGPLGAIVGNVSKYRFDGVNLFITAAEPLRERDQG